jgi:hypothetical protein
MLAHELVAEERIEAWAVHAAEWEAGIGAVKHGIAQ